MAVIKVSARLQLYLGKMSASKWVQDIGRIHFLVVIWWKGTLSLCRMPVRDYTQVLEVSQFFFFFFFLPYGLPQYGSLLHQVSQENLC